jgi:hypothetical protein
VAPQKFLTIPEELLEVADAIVAKLKQSGYTVSIEKIEYGFPFTPCLVGKRGQTKVIVEVLSKPADKRIEQWKSFCRSCSKDTRFALAAPETAGGIMGQIERLRKDGIGLFSFTNDKQILEKVSPKDLAVNVNLPSLADFCHRFRKLMGPAFEKVADGYWREGFEDACLVVEQQAREHLISGIRSQRIIILDNNGKDATPQISKVRKYTLGQLAGAFRRIKNQNAHDAMILRTLPFVNPDRVRVVHHRNTHSTEAKLRKNVGQHMWALIACMKELCC